MEDTVLKIDLKENKFHVDLNQDALIKAHWNAGYSIDLVFCLMIRMAIHRFEKFLAANMESFNQEQYHASFIKNLSCMFAHDAPLLGEVKNNKE